MRIWHYLGCALLIASPGPALAADKPVVRPPASWVRASALPARSSADATAALHMLLVSRQDNLVAGGQDTYVETAFLVRRPEGLQAAGNISLAWKPDTDTLAVHAIEIVRAAERIDLIPKAGFTVLRRETNLEQAVLDGMLTATLQAEGLRVGDIVRVAYTLERRDPVLGGRAGTIMAGMLQGPTDRLLLSARWPAARDVRHRVTLGLAAPRLTGKDGVRELVVDMAGAVPPKPPEGAPPRYHQLAQLELSDFGSWNAVAATMVPLYAKASVITPGSELDAEAKRIAAASPDPVRRAEAALRLVQDGVRYVFLGMDQGGYIPASAEQTWSRRFGDCKGKTALLLALLARLDIEAEPALVSTRLGDGLDQRLPTLEAFDHILVRATVGGRVHWLDGTRTGDRALARVAVPPFRFALPVRASGAALVALAQAPLDLPAIETDLAIDASRGLALPAPFTGRVVMRGDLAIATRLGLDNIPAADRPRALEQIWTKSLDWLQPGPTTVAVDEATGDLTLSASGTATMPWIFGDGAPRYIVDASKIRWNWEPKRDDGDKTVPWTLPFPIYTRSRETVRLPAGGEGFTTTGNDYARSLGGLTLRRASTIAAGQLTVESVARTTAPEVAAAEAEAVARMLSSLARAPVTLRAAESYQLAAADIDALVARELKTAADFNQRGSLLLDRGDARRALADFERAVAADPENALAHANAGVANVWLGQLEPAAKALAEARARDPDEVVVANGEGLLDKFAGRCAPAIVHFTRAIALKRGNAFALRERALCHATLGDTAAALADADTLIALAPAKLAPLAFKTELLGDAGRLPEALAAVDRRLAATPGDAPARVLRGMILVQLDRKPEAIAEFDPAIAAAPSAHALVGRARARGADARAAAYADVERALALEPLREDALATRAGLRVQDKAYDRALAELGAFERAHPEATAPLMIRSEVLFAAGRVDEGIATLERAAARAKGDAMVRNNLCWERATRGRPLDRALADCLEALRLDPGNAAALDSLGFVRLRMGQFDQAIEAYSKALERRPGMAPSHYGRGIARLRKGETAEAARDLAAARTRYPEVDETFKRYGVTP